MITEGHDGQNTGNKLPIVSEKQVEQAKEAEEKIALKVDTDWE